MSYPLIAFYLFASVAVLSALSVVSVRNPVHAVLFLILTFFSSACLWILADAEFLGIALVLVYVGAVMVLFLFVVMMLDIKFAPLREGFARYLPVGIVVGIVMALEMIALIGLARFGETLPATDPATAAGMSNTEWLGRALFTEYLYPFELAAVILTVAIVAAIAITLRRRINVKAQDPGRQVMVRREDRIRLVKMKAETPEARQ
ncbi:NADH-quinone oxidoreductase subunit J [Aquimonas voraii]|uniref:NADH-quinone oxidoreductase subunit J n=1 Tax=Aquimonas voraii TaxID=265719 RepID=A0A1G6UGZ7_9GAMM|nr:NADH-quinone oxidoreductase subunit J [Aquimonas voraii]SDD39996.1 NADH-quinone oxidoreductase subunit J [Aquimonas voraii]